MANKDFIKSKNNSGYGYQPLGPSPKGGDMHETFKVNKDGKVSNGHTTVRIPGGQSVKMPWPKK